MANTQLYLAIGVPVLALIFAMATNFSLISRIDKRIDDMRDLLRAEIATSEAKITAVIEKNHSEMMLKFVDLDQRLSRIEGERRIVG